MIASQPQILAGYMRDLLRLVLIYQDTLIAAASAWRYELARLTTTDPMPFSTRTEMQEILDTLEANTAVLDADGTIVAVNRAWRNFAGMNGLASMGCGEGMNYLAICDTAAQAGIFEAGVFAHGIRGILAGQINNIDCEYPCHSPDSQRWFFGRVSRLSTDEQHAILVLHVDITVNRNAE